MVKKKILFFLQDGVGGAERMTVLFGKSLPREQYDVSFYVVERGGDTSIQDFIPDGYRVCVIPNAAPMKMMWRLMRTIQKEKPHVVCSSVMYLNTKILPFRSLFPKTRFVVRCENNLFTFNKKQHAFIKLTYRLADAIIAQTKEMADELVEQVHIEREKITVLQNPVDSELIDKKIAEGKNPYPNNGKKHFVASGRFAYQKGFDLLIRAFYEVTKKRDDVDLYIIGSTDFQNGEVHQEITRFAEENGIQNLVHCVGYQGNPYVYIKYAGCFVLSSRWEGLPNVLIEAQYLGTPAAAFKCIPVIERIVTDKENGYLADKEDVFSLAEAMRKAIDMGRIKSTYRSTSVGDFVKVCVGGQVASRRQVKY